MNENYIIENNNNKINTTKINRLFINDSENKSKTVVIKGKDNITALWNEFEALFGVEENIPSYRDLKKIEFNHFISSLKNEKSDYSKNIEQFILSIPNPGVRELIDSYINQRPSMLFTVLDNDDNETINQLFLCEQKTESGLENIFPISHKLHNCEHIGYVRVLEEKLKIGENGSWIGSDDIVEKEIGETYFAYNTISESLDFCN